ncbi:MAG: hypothetical protein P9L95_03680 [Candidatus Tenebribacter mawsonii]|nr:hypothetical protein [Candidatus Tenebribacter mawsonii]
MTKTKLTKEQIDYFESIEDNARHWWHKKDVGREIAEAGDKEWARLVYEKAEKQANGPFDYKALAVEVADEAILGDKDWARKLFKKVEKRKSNTCSDYIDLAGKVADEDVLGDIDWSQKLYLKAEKKAKHSMDYERLASYASKRAHKLYKKAGDLAEDSGDYRNLAVSIADEATLADKTWARKLFQKAEEIAKHFDDYRWLIPKVLICFGNEGQDWACRLYEKAKEIGEEEDMRRLNDEIANETATSVKDWAHKLNIKLSKKNEKSDPFSWSG